jgi:hypothetical protein
VAVARWRRRTGHGPVAGGSRCRSGQRGAGTIDLGRAGDLRGAGDVERDACCGLRIPGRRVQAGPQLIGGGEVAEAIERGGQRPASLDVEITPYADFEGAACGRHRAGVLAVGDTGEGRGDMVNGGVRMVTNDKLPLGGGAGRIADTFVVAGDRTTHPGAQVAVGQVRLSGNGPGVPHQQRGLVPVGVCAAHQAGQLARCGGRDRGGCDRRRAEPRGGVDSERVYLPPLAVPAGQAQPVQAGERVADDRR